jgi:hypothetical protein
MTPEIYQRVRGLLDAKALPFPEWQEERWHTLATAEGAAAGGLAVILSGSGAATTHVVLESDLETDGGDIRIRAEGQDCIVVLQGGRTRRAPSFRLNLYSNAALVILNLDEMHPILPRPLTVELTTYNGPDQIFFWDAGASSVHTVVVLDGPGNSVMVGLDAMLSNGIYLRTHDGHGLVDLKSGAVVNGGGDVRIGRHVWVGQDCLVMGPSSIGGGSVVAAKSMVKGDHPGCTAIGGVPAKTLRTDISWSRVPDSTEFLQMELARIGLS